MPEQPKSTAEAPAVTPAERKAQLALMKTVGKLAVLRARLWRLHLRLGEAAEDDDMAEGRASDSVRFSVRGAIECAIDDRLAPAMETLEKAARDTPESLAREWRKRVAERAQ